MRTYSAIWSPQLKAAIIENNKEPLFDITMSSLSDANSIMMAVNEGIDSHLEACYVKERRDSYEWKGQFLICHVSKESLPTLIRRLLESPNENSRSIAIDMCYVIGIELI